LIRLFLDLMAWSPSDQYRKFFLFLTRKQAPTSGPVSFPGGLGGGKAFPTAALPSGICAGAFFSRNWPP